MKRARAWDESSSDEEDGSDAGEEMDELGGKRWRFHFVFRLSLRLG
jgi:hypothetical protein